MTSAEVTWVCCPAGIDGGVLNLSVVAVPRLEPDDEDATLSALATFGDWPALVREIAWTVQAEADGSAPAGLAGEPPDSRLWQAMFPTTTPVRRPGSPTDRGNQPVVTYPVVDAAASVRALYANAVADEASGGDRRTATAAARGVFDIGALRDFRADILARVAESRARCERRGPDDRVAVEVVPATRNTPVAQAFAMQQLSRLTSVQADQPPPAPVLDFHQVLTLLGQHPALLRRLGLLVDLSIAAADLGDQPGRIRIGADGLPGTLVHRRPWTQVLLDVPAGRFVAAARDPGHQDGAWPLDRPEFGLEQLDVDSAVRNGVALASHPVSQDDPGTLPALRGDGIAVVHTGRATSMVERLAGAVRRRDSRADADLTLTAEDLRRGARLDVADDTTGQWQSLHARHVWYDVDGFGPVHGGDGVEDEGWLDPVATGDTELYVHEKVATWRGWSLSAPPPHPAAPDLLVQQDLPTTEPLAALRVHLRTRVQPGTLPRLRYGRSYRARLRDVDLAGGGVSLSNAPDTAAGPLRYLRYEPVPPPVVAQVAGAEGSFGPGETMHRLVVRAVAVPDGELVLMDEAYQATERLLLPPRGSVTLAEQHGVLDDLLGAGRGANAALLRDLAVRSTADLPIGDTVPWLPDPMAGGLAFTNLPGVDDGEPFSVPFDAPTWDSARPLRLRVESREPYLWPDGTAPPVHDPETHTLTVYLAEGEQRRVRVSCVPRWPELMALVDDCMKDADGSVRDAVRRRVADGLHEMVSPALELDLVHASYRSAVATVLGSITPLREAGTGAVGVQVQMSLDPATTGSVSLEASWEEPVDHDPADPSGHPGRLARSAVLLTRTVHQDETELRIDTDADNLPPTELGTGYRRLTVRPVTASRFGDCYPAGTTRTTTGAGVEVLVPNVSVPAPVVVRSVGPSLRVEPQHLETSDEAMAEITVVTGEPDEFPLEAGWTRLVQERRGGGIRVSLERPWLATGDGELLGVVVASPDWLDDTLGPPGDDSWRIHPGSPLLQWCSQWGQDPVRSSRGVHPLTASAFIGAERADPIPALPDASPGEGEYGWTMPVTVLGYAPTYDAAGGLWHADVVVDVGEAHQPFVRLAVVRYQPNSASTDLGLSPVTTLAPVQPLPDRRLTLLRRGEDPGAVLTLHGTSYVPSDIVDTPRVTCRMYTAPTFDSTVWQPVDAFAEIVLARDETLALWSAPVDLSVMPPGSAARLLVVEKERFRSWGGPEAERVGYVGHLDLSWHPPVAPEPFEMVEEKP